MSSMIQIQKICNGGPEVLFLQEASLPVPREDEVLIEVYAAGVNRPDLLQRQGNYPPPPDASPILGLEVAGKVVSAPASSKFKTGDSICALVHGGGYAQYCVAPESQCLPIPEGLSMEEAAGIPENYFTVWANLFQLGKLKSGESFLVHGGTSGIGTTAIQLARSMGAAVFATAGSETKIQICKKLGATQAYNYKIESFEEKIMSATSNRGVDVILDMIGGPYTKRNIESLAEDGRLVQIAFQQGSMVNVDLLKIMQKRLILTGSFLRPRSIKDKGKIADELFQHVWPLLEAKAIKVMVNKVFPLKEVCAAHTFLESGENVGKVILKVR